MVTAKNLNNLLSITFLKKDLSICTASGPPWFPLDSLFEETVAQEIYKLGLIDQHLFNCFCWSLFRNLTKSHS